MRRACVCLAVCLTLWDSASAQSSATATGDPALQQAVTRAMAGRSGAAVVIDVATGKVLAAYHLEVAARRLALPGSSIKTVHAAGAAGGGQGQRADNPDVQAPADAGRAQPGLHPSGHEAAARSCDGAGVLVQLVLRNAGHAADACRIARQFSQVRIWRAQRVGAERSGGQRSRWPARRRSYNCRRSGSGVCE